MTTTPTTLFRCIVWQCAAWVPHGRNACREHARVVCDGGEIMMRCSRPGCAGIASVLLGSDTAEEAAKDCLCDDCSMTRGAVKPELLGKPLCAR